MWLSFDCKVAGEMKKTGNTIAKNVVHLFYSTALSSALNATALIVLASYLQSYQYGLFSVALAYAMIMGYFTDVGLSNIVLREGSKKETNIEVLMSSYIKMRFLLLVGTFACGFPIIYLLQSGNKQLMITAFYLIIPLVSGIALQSIGTTYFQLIEEMQYFGLIRIISAVLLVTSISVGMLLSLHPLIICILYGFSYFLAGCVGLILVSKRVKLRLKSTFHQGILQNLGAFTIGGLLFVILPHLGPIVLEKTLSLMDVGFFAVAYRIPQALQQIPFVVAGAYYPVLFRYANNNLLNEHVLIHITQIKIMALIGMAMTIPFFYLGDFIIRILFGEVWGAAVVPLKILAMMLTFQSINIALADGLTTRGLQTYRTVIQAVAFFFGIILYFFFSKLNGIIGAAVAGVTIEVIALLGFWLFIPNCWLIGRKAIMPYVLFFVISLITIDYFVTIPLLAASIHISLLGVIIMIDQELKGKINHYVREKGRTRKVEGMKGVSS